MSNNNTSSNNNNNQQKPNIVILSIEAAIGTGKSSLLRMLQRQIAMNSSRNPSPPDTPTFPSSSSLGKGGEEEFTLINAKNWKWVFVQEPVEMWQDVRKFHSDPNYMSRSASEVASNSSNSSGSPTTGSPTTASATMNADEDSQFNLLGKFYDSPPEYAFKLQSWAVLSRIETVSRTIADISREFSEEGDRRPVVLILERSWHSDRNTFAMMHRESGCMSPMEWCMYDQMYSFASRNSPNVDGHVYLECAPDTCMKRLKKRDRGEESGVSADYQTALIKKHEDWLETCEKETILRIDVDEEFIGNEVRAKFVYDEICTFAVNRFHQKFQHDLDHLHARIHDMVMANQNQKQLLNEETERDGESPLPIRAASATSSNLNDNNNTNISSSTNSVSSSNINNMNSTSSSNSAERVDSISPPNSSSVVVS